MAFCETPHWVARRLTQRRTIQDAKNRPGGDRFRSPAFLAALNERRISPPLCPAAPCALSFDRDGRFRRASSAVQA
jgi:hypothetical protein